MTSKKTTNKNKNSYGTEDRRDMFGDLCISSEKPVRNNGCWEICDGIEISDSDWFPDLTWDSEPIELVIKEKEE